MSRQLRINIPDGIYHVTNRGLERRLIVRDDLDRSRWLKFLAAAAQRHQWRVLAWVLMSNHYHLFLRTPGGDLSRGMQSINSGYAAYFNRRHSRWGPLFMGRFKSILLEKESHYWELSRYIHLNPVRAGITNEPESFAWSSCRGYFNRRFAPDWLAWEEVLVGHGQTIQAARSSYRKYLKEGITDPPSSPFINAVASALLGSAQFIENIRQKLSDQPQSQDVPAARVLQKEVSVDSIEAVVCRSYKVDQSTLKQRGKHRNDPRQIAIYLTKKLSLLDLRSIGLRYGGVGPSAVSNIYNKVAELRQENKDFDLSLRKMEKKIKKEK